MVKHEKRAQEQVALMNVVFLFTDGCLVIIHQVKHTLVHVPSSLKQSYHSPLGMYFTKVGGKGMQPMTPSTNSAFKRAVVDLGLDK